MQIIQSNVTSNISNIKENDIVRYPLGLFKLNVRRVYKDDNGELYVIEGINTTGEYKRYVNRSMHGYKWNTSLNLEMGFRLANSAEIQMLED